MMIAALKPPTSPSSWKKVYAYLSSLRFLSESTMLKEELGNAVFEPVNEKTSSDSPTAIPKNSCRTSRGVANFRGSTSTDQKPTGSYLSSNSFMAIGK